MTTNDDGIEKLWEKIKISREWAIKYFNVSQAKKPEIFNEGMKMRPTSFFVEFPKPDIMLISPSIMGKPHLIWITYKLAFNPDGSTQWEGNHPIYGYPFKALKVIES